MQFSTYEVDNDEWNWGNCATEYGYGGNWYYEQCTGQNMNGKFGEDGDEGQIFMYWSLFDYNYMALQKIRWMLREV